MFALWELMLVAVKVEDLHQLLQEMVVEETIIITLSLSNLEEMIEVERIIIISIEVDDHHHQLHHHLLKIEKEKEVMITTTLNDGKSALEVVRTTITTIIVAVEMKGVSPQSILHPHPLLRNILELPVSEIVLLETIVEIEVLIIEMITISHLTPHPLLNLTTTILDVKVDAFREQFSKTAILISFF